jgi:hypothetical protein
MMGTSGLLRRGLSSRFRDSIQSDSAFEVPLFEVAVAMLLTRLTW